MNKKVIAIGATFALCVSMLTGCGSTQIQTQQQAEVGTAVNTTIIESQDFERVIHIGGTTKAVASVYIIPMVSGMEEITSVKVKVGDHVTAGQTLATLKGESARLQYDAAKLQYDDLVRTLERMEALYEVGAIAKSDYEQTLLGVQSTESSLRGYKIALDNMNVTTPISGTVTMADAVEGGYATASSPMFEVANIDELEISIGVNENVVHKLQVGDTVTVEVPSARETSHYTGVIKEIGLAMLQGSKSYPVTIGVDNAEGNLLAGMYAKVGLTTDKVSQGIVVPVDAIGYHDGEPYVMVVEDSRAQEKRITTGVNDGEFYEVTSGLSVGDELIVKGNMDLVSGELVAIVEGSGLPAPKSAQDHTDVTEEN